MGCISPGLFGEDLDSRGNKGSVERGVFRIADSIYCAASLRSCVSCENLMTSLLGLQSVTGMGSVKSRRG